jgi:uncharacterized protein (TIGR03435 family)
MRKFALRVTRFGMSALMKSLLLLIVMGAPALPPLHAQEPAQLALTAPAAGRPSFEVASVKENKSSDQHHWNVALGAGDFMRPVGNRFAVSNVALGSLIAFAYKLTDDIDYVMPGLPAWVNSEKFDIEARAADPMPTKDQFRLMMQSLLADRFKLTTHDEVREIAVFAFVLAKPGKLGPKLTQHTDDSTCPAMGTFQGIGNQSGAKPTITAKSTVLSSPCGVIVGLDPSVPGRVRSAGQKVPLSFLAAGFSGQAIYDRPVVDRTGLAGTFDYDLEFVPPASIMPSGFEADPSGPSLQEALQDQLGIKVEPQKAPVHVLVVDHIEQPSPN